MTPIAAMRKGWCGGFGDASGLRVVDLPVGWIGCLICWKNYTLLSRFALFA